MLKLFILLVLTTVIFIQTVPAYCAGSKTMTYQISVTIPEHVMANNGLSVTPFSNNPGQLIQNQIVVRDNKSINVTSIVVP